MPVAALVRHWECLPPMRCHQTQPTRGLPGIARLASSRAKNSTPCRGSRVFGQLGGPQRGLSLTPGTPRLRRGGPSWLCRVSWLGPNPCVLGDEASTLCAAPCHRLISPPRIPTRHRVPELFLGTPDARARGPHGSLGPRPGRTLGKEDEMRVLAIGAGGTPTDKIHALRTFRPCGPGAKHSSDMSTLSANASNGLGRPRMTSRCFDADVQLSDHDNSQDQSRQEARAMG